MALDVGEVGCGCEAAKGISRGEKTGCFQGRPSENRLPSWGGGSICFYEQDCWRALEQFRKLAANDQRELFDLLLRELAVLPADAPPASRRSLAEVTGKYRPTPNAQTASHDAGFAQAIARDDHFDREGIRLP